MLYYDKIDFSEEIFVNKTKSVDISKFMLIYPKSMIFITTAIF